MSVFRTLKTSFTGGEYSDALNARVDLAGYHKGVKKAKNCFIHPHGGMSNRAGFEFLSYTHPTLTVQIPFIIDTDSKHVYVLLFSAGRILVTRSGHPVYDSTSEEIFSLSDIQSSVTDEVYGRLRFVRSGHFFDSGDLVTVFSEGNPEIHKRDCYVDEGSGYFSLRSADGAPLPKKEALSEPLTIKKRVCIRTPFSTSNLRYLSYVQDANVMYIASGGAHPLQILSWMEDDVWSLKNVDFNPVMRSPSRPSVSATNGPGYDSQYAKNVKYKVSAVSSVTGEESLPSSSVDVDCDLYLSGSYNTVSWPAVSGASSYVVYKNSTGVFGYAGMVTETKFIDVNVAEGTTDTPQQFVDLFSKSHPETVTLHEQRLVLTLNGSEVHLSKSVNIENFNTSMSAKADDAISFKTKNKEYQKIRSVISTPAGLALFSSSAEWLVNGGNPEAAITPSEIHARIQTRYGSGLLPPLNVGDFILFSTARGAAVRDFAYSFEKNIYTGQDRTIMARHLFEGRTIVSWCYAKSPYSIVWCVRDDGVLLSLTFMPEHNVWGWTQHETDGVVQSVVSVPEDNEDAVYITVKRKVNGADRYFHERMRSRLLYDVEDWFFVDCGLQYRGDPVSEVSGLYHLEGESVAVLADGFVVEGKKVENGRVALERPASTVVVGLPYTTHIETLEIDLGVIQELGHVIGRFISVPQVVLDVSYTRGVFVGPNADSLVEWKQRSSEAYGVMIQPYTGKIRMSINSRFNDGATIHVSQLHPLPMTILALGTDIDVGG